MKRRIVQLQFRLIIFAASVLPMYSQTNSGQDLSFEVATIKPADPEDRSGRFITMQGARQFVARNYSTKFMIAAAYNLPPRLISGGPSWIDTEFYNIVAATPGSVRPNLDDQMSMLRTLLADRFKLSFHREKRELSNYELTVARSGAKLKKSEAPATDLPVLVNRIFSSYVILPARNATMAQFTSMLQRSVVDRPVVDKTGLSERYDFDLEWTADDSQFGGALPPVNPDIPRKPDLFAALQQQLGLRLESAKGPVEVLVIDSIEKPSDN